MSKNSSTYRQLEPAKLQLELAKLRQDRNLAYIELNAGKLNNTGRIAQLTKQIAQVATILREKQILNK